MMDNMMNNGGCIGGCIVDCETMMTIFPRPPVDKIVLFLKTVSDAHCERK